MLQQADSLIADRPDSAGAQQSDKVKKLLDNRTILGVQAAYYYNTMFGPLGASLGYSNHTKKPYFYLNLGYEFVMKETFKHSRKTESGVSLKAVMLLMAVVLLPIHGEAQRLLTLDSCRAMALRNNKQMSVAKVKQDVNAHLQKSARTKYLPHVNALGGYVWTSKEISMLSEENKETLNGLGTNAAASLSGTIGSIVSQLPAAAQAQLAQGVSQFAGSLDQVGAGLVNAMRTDTRNMFAGAVTVTQPVFMGGAITAANKIADINVEMAANSLELKRQGTLYNIDQAYWQVVSLRQKQKLAESYVSLVKKLKSDVQKMIDQGVGTKGDGLSVSVRVNEAEMALTQVTDGLALSKMLLCQLCGLPVNENITLADEEVEGLNVNSEGYAAGGPSLAMQNRPELKVLQNTVDLTKQTTNMLKAGKFLERGRAGTRTRLELG